MPTKAEIIDQNSEVQGAAKLSKDDFVRRAQSWWSDADQNVSDWLEEERKDHAFFHGHQWDEKDVKIFEESGRVPIVINRLRSHALVVIGQERMNRLRIRYLPVEFGDTDRAEQWSEVARVVQEQGDIDFTKSEAFGHQVVGGRGFMRLRIDFLNNPAGEIVADQVMPWDVRIDPACTKFDLSDARYMIQCKAMAFEQVLALWPEKEDELRAIQDTAGSLSSSKYPTEPVDDQNDTVKYINTDYDQKSKTWQVKEIWYWQIEKLGEYSAFNPQTQDWEPIKDKSHLMALQIIDPNLQFEGKATYKKQYYQAFVVGPICLENQKTPYEKWQGFPYIPFFGLKDDISGRYIGIVNPLRDPQMETNKRRAQMLHILNKSVKSGWYGPQGAFVDRDMWEDDASRVGVVLEYDAQAKQPPQPLVAPPIPASMLKLDQMAATDFRDISGVNLELSGLATKEVPGILANMRQKQGLTILQPIYDNLRRSHKILGRFLLALMQQFYTDGRAMQILGKQGPEWVALNEFMAIGRYDLVAEEAPWSPNQKMENASKIIELAGMAAKMGAPVPPAIFDYLDLPGSLAADWKQLYGQFMAMKMGPPPGAAPPIPSPGPPQPQGPPPMPTPPPRPPAPPIVLPPGMSGGGLPIPMPPEFGRSSPPQGGPMPMPGAIPPELLQQLLTQAAMGGLQ